jgi:hypothetical protein
VATKEFLNELVKRFPERPPVFPSPIQTKILELIQEWKATICVSSKHKEDLVHIRDMHRLLGYKGEIRQYIDIAVIKLSKLISQSGYRFPNVDSRAAGVMNVESVSMIAIENLIDKLTSSSRTHFGHQKSSRRKIELHKEQSCKSSLGEGHPVI